MKKRITILVFMFWIMVSIVGCFGSAVPSQEERFKQTANAVTVAAIVRKLSLPFTQTAVMKTVSAEFTRVSRINSPTPESTPTFEEITTTPSMTATPQPLSIPTVINVPVYTPVTGICNWAGYIMDVTFPDGTQVSPGGTFRKTWRIQNLGNCAWGPNYLLMYEMGTQMNAPIYIPVTQGNVPPGGIIDISVDLMAPTTPGNYQAIFRLRSPDGSNIPINNHGDGSLWALVSVGLPQPCNWAGFIMDVTYPDGTTVNPGEAINKVWRIQNIGSCSWNSNYQLLFSSGDRLGAPDFIQFTQNIIPPGSFIDISIKLTAPNNAGTFTSYFKMRAPDSSIFGTGSNADGSIWVKVVIMPTPTTTPSLTPIPPTLTITPSVTPVTPTLTVTSSATPITPSPTVTPSPTPITPTQTPLTPSATPITPTLTPETPSPTSP